jgi:hypothetical protein
MKPDPKDASLSEWTLQTVPALGLVVVVVAVLIHVGARVAWGELVRAGVAVFLIQAGTVVAMFWAVKYWRRTRDPRPAFALSGLYLVALISTGEHYASRWKLISPQDTLEEAGLITLITFGWLVFLSWWRWREKRSNRCPIHPDSHS